MGATINVYWPGITEEQADSQPGFYNDDKAWGDWMAIREEEPEALAAIRRLGAEAILTVKTDGWEDDDVKWVTPQQLRDAAMKIREAVAAGTPDAGVILESYRKTGIFFDEPLAVQFTRDLDDVIEIATWAEEEGASQMTLEVNW